MATRLVTGTILRTNGEPWVNGKVLFVRTCDSYTTDYQYPGDSITGFTNESGELRYLQGDAVLNGVPLWVNEEGSIGSSYTCIFPNKRNRFAFTLPLGTAPISLSELRAVGMTSNDPQYPTLATYVDNQIGLHNVDSNAHPNLDGGAGRIKVEFAFGDATPKAITTLPANTTVLTSQIIITEVFNGVGSSLQLGDNSVTNRFLDIPSAGLQDLFEFETNSTHTYTSETDVILTIAPGTGASTGKGLIIIEI